MSPERRGRTVHLHAQEAPHDEAYLIADRAGLQQARACIDRALDDPSGLAAADLFTADGEGYSLLVLVADPPELGADDLPYTAPDALDPRPRAVHPAALLLRGRTNGGAPPAP